MKFATFYNETIRKTVVAFGSLFDDVFVQRKDSAGTLQKKILVPITYSPKEKFYRMLKEYPILKGNESDVHIGNILPRMGFAITTIDYDGTRKRNTVSRRFDNSTVDSSTGLVLSNQAQYAEVPYTIGFNLSIAARTNDDALQILEQILPYFTPEFSLSINYTTVFNTKIDVPITLTGVSPEVEFEGDTAEQRNIIYNLSFTAQTYLFSPIKTNKIIRETQVSGFFSNFDANGGISGPTGAAFLSVSSITGPSGASSMPPDASVTTETFEFGLGLSITGGTYDV